ncbi:MAG: aldehyde ferredoxin oxidoreductase C-terminal domain-containing protein [Candidatus Bathyarchaeia archaeon]
MKGYAGKLLEIDLSTGNIKETKVDEAILKDYIGGRGLATKILWDRLGANWDNIDPLGPENLLLFLTGPLTGFFPGGRICVSGKSPQNNGVIGSTVAGEFGIELKCAGYDGLIISGQAERPVYILIKDSEVEIKRADHIWGLDGKRTVATLTKECRKIMEENYPRKGLWKEPAILYIGPAGENLVRIAVVAAKWTHAAGYGGYGAVMGSKRLKAIAVKGTGPLPEVANIDEVMKLTEEVCKHAFENELWRRWGTGTGGYKFGAKTSSEPIRNWQEEWHDEKRYGVDKFENRFWVKSYWGDFGCPTTCLKISVIRDGKFKGAITDNPDYELQAYLGTNLGIFSPEANVYLSALIDDLGLCGIQTGNVMGFAAELFQRGILKAEDLDGIELNWGDVEAFANLAKKIAHKEGIGRILADGTYRAALEIGRRKGVNVLPYAVQVKGVGVGAHGIRSRLDYVDIYGYACSVQCGDHTSVAQMPLDHPGSELMTILLDSGVCCSFNTFELPKIDLLFDFYSAVTGVKLTRSQWIRGGGLKILHLQRAMLLLGGPDVKWKPDIDDDNPPRFYEPLVSGPCKGRIIEREDVRKEKRRYYEAVGWDERGIPKREVLTALGLDDVDKALEKIRKEND